MVKRSPKKKPADGNGQSDYQQLARKVLDAVAPDAEKADDPPKNHAAVAMGRLGGLKGGKARAAKLTAEQRSEIAKKAAAARWKSRDA